MGNIQNHCLEAEQAVLGGLLVDNPKWPLITDILDIHDFYQPQNQIIFKTIKVLASNQTPFDTVTVTDHLKDNGKLQEVGTEATLYELALNTPSTANIETYAQIVKTKSTERAIANIVAEIQSDLENSSNASRAELTKKISKLLELSLHRESRKLYLPLALPLFLGKDIPPRKLIMEPWLPEQGIAMIYAPRGIGKTYFALNISIAIATGQSLFDWQVPLAKRVLYLDGEMSAADMQARLKNILQTQQAEITENFSLLTPDLQDFGMPDLSTIEGQSFLNPIVEDFDLLVIDNLATLCRSGKENETEGWRPVQEWLLTLRRKGKTVILIHHAGKSGSQRGSSAKEDIIDTVISLRRPTQYEKERDGDAFELHFEKHRGFSAVDAKAILIEQIKQDDGTFQWLSKPLEQSTYEKVITLTQEGLKPFEITQELEINKSTVSRHLKAAREKGELLI